jgi:predicted porin
MRQRHMVGAGRPYVALFDTPQTIEVRFMAKKQLKPAILSIAIAAGLATSAMPAQALTLGISGQINKTIGYIDNGDDSALGFFDNSISGSRFRFTGEEDIGGGLKVGGVWEWQWQNSPTSEASFNSNGKFNETTATLQDRKTELYFAGKWGKVSLGKGDGAANGSAEVDLSGTTTIDYSGGNQDLLSAMTYGGSPTGITVGSTYSEFDGESRNDRLRYDTPKLAKVLTISGSVANANEREIAVWYAQNVGSAKVAAALGYTDNKDATTTSGTIDRTRTALSASALLKNGLNFTISYSTQDNKAPTPSQQSTNSYFKIGWTKGKNAVSLSYGQQSGDPLNASLSSSAEPSSIAVSYNYTLVRDVEVYAGLRTSSADSSGLDDVTGVWIGSRIKWE